MKEDEAKRILINFGLSESAAEYYANLELSENNNLAWLAAFRFVRPLNKSLEFYKKGYGDMLKTRINKGLNNSDVETELLKSGIDPDLLGKFAYEIALTAFSQLLYRLSDPAGSDYDLVNEGAGLPSWTFMERDANYEITNRRVAESHSLIPFSNL